MADIRCPKCGRENPASLSICQYCQTPLTADNTLHIGDKPTKKNTGELEPVLPDWLQDVRRQARDSVERDASVSETLPKMQKAEPPDLLAGLASQSSNADEEDIPGWLSSLGPKATDKPASSAATTGPDPDFFSQFADESSGPLGEPPANASKNEVTATSPEQDELSDWFSQASEQPGEPFSLESDSETVERGWDFREISTPNSSHESASQPAEDLSWLRDLEAESKKTGDLSMPKQDDWAYGVDTPPAPAPSSQDDLSWLDNLGTRPASEPSQQGPSAQGEDLSWLHNFPETSEPSQLGDAPSAGQEDLSWLKDLGSLPPASEPTPAKSQEDLSWLHDLSGISESSQNIPASPASPEDQSRLDEQEKATEPSQSPEQAATDDDLGWLRDLQGKPGSFSSALDAKSMAGEAVEPMELPKVPPFTPGTTGSLAADSDTDIPDWLKGATEEPSLPLGPQALDQIKDDKKGPDISVSAAIAAGSIFGAVSQQDETPKASQPGTPGSEAAPLFSQDVDSIFSQDMPDWLAQSETKTGETPEDIGVHAEGGETLSPADLPAWVQAMRPVEAAISEAGPGVADQPMEQHGPLAGLKGVLPMVAIGSFRRPQPIPLTLQASSEQQANAAILEQILTGETTPRPLISTPVMASQQRLRWMIAGLIFLVLGAMLFSGTQVMPIPAILPPAANNVSTSVQNIADNAPVLVILDYEPGLAGEMEAVSGPVLSQLVLLHNPYLSFIATTPGGNVLVERLLSNTDISQPDGTGYVAGQNYTNLGYLPGGESGVLAFLQSPQSTIPSSPVLEFSEYAAILLLTDHSDSARTWVEQLHVMKQSDPMLASQPLLTISSAQSGPMLQPYFYSGQITGLISGLPIAARYEAINGNRPGIARSYWDTFGAGMMMAVALIVLGSLWSVYSGYRNRHASVVKE